MQAILLCSVFTGLVLASPFHTDHEAQDFSPSDDITNSLRSSELTNVGTKVVTPNLEDEDTGDFNDYENLALEDAVDFMGGITGVGSFKFIPGGVKLFTEGNGLPDEETRSYAETEDYDLEFPQQNGGRSWYGDLVALNARMADSERSSTDSTASLT